MRRHVLPERPALLLDDGHDTCARCGRKGETTTAGLAGDVDLGVECCAGAWLSEWERFDGDVRAWLESGALPAP